MSIHNENAILSFAISGQALKQVQELVLFDDKVILLLSPEISGERNIACYSLSGNKMWLIASPIRVHPQHETYYVGLCFQYGKLLAYSKDGVEYDISLETGNFNQHELVK